MLTRKTWNVRSTALFVTFILVLLLVIISFVLLSFDLLNARHLLKSVGLHWNNTDEIHRLNKFEREDDLQYEELTSSQNEELLHTTEWPSEVRTQGHFSSDHGSSSTTTSLPNLSSASRSFTINVRTISSSTAVYQGQSDSFAESAINNGSSVDDSFLERQNAVYQSDPDFTRIVDNFVDMLLEENDIITDSITQENATSVSLINTSTTVSDFSQRAVAVDEESRADQRIPYQAKIPHFSRITNLFVPIVTIEEHSPTTTATPPIQSATSTVPVHISTYKTPNVKKPEVIATLTKGSNVEIMEAVTSPVDNSVRVLAKPRTTDTTFESFPTTASSKYMPTVATREHFRWWLNEARDASKRQQESVFTLTTTHAAPTTESSNLEFSSQIGKRLPYRPLGHSASISSFSISSADKGDQRSSAWRVFPHIYSNLTSVTKPRESSDLKLHHNTRPLINGHSQRPMRLTESMNSPGGTDKGRKSSKQKILPNATDDSLSWPQKEFNHSAKNTLQLHHFHHWHHQLIEVNQRLISEAANAYSNHRHISEIIPKIAKHPQIHQRDDSGISSPTPLINGHKPIVTTLSENKSSQKISAFPWMAPFPSFESKDGNDRNPALKTIESLEASSSSGGQFEAIEVDSPLIIPDMPRHHPVPSPPDLSLSPVQKNPWSGENILDVGTSKVSDEERSHESNVDHSLEGIDTLFDVIKVYPHTLTIPNEHKEHSHRHEHQYNHDSPIIVTALFDIGRGKWIKYTRTYTQYMNYLENLLTLNNRMVIFTDHTGAEFVRRKRHTTNTEIFEITIRNIPLYRYRDEMEQILTLEQREWKYDQKTKDKPESKSADYDVLVNSKVYFLYNATQSSKFRASATYYAWIDAGYGHGDKNVIPLYCHWKPTFRDGLITVIKLTPEHDKISRYSINDLYRVDWSVVSGGFLAGDSTTIYRFYRFYTKTFLDLLDAQKVDDDQTILTLTMKDYASLFNIIHSHGDWFALFRLFPCMK
uniref:Uncharacterized protein n=1 Tax=Parascaris univalens TaxID=6257 RepID=A0A915BP35_PARUN